MEFNEKLKMIRIQSSMTQRQLGDIVGVSVMTIRNWESGAKQPSMQAIIALSSALHVSSDFILGIKEQPSPERYAVSRREASMLSNYRLLDWHGKKVVDTVCSLEKSRVEDAHRHNCATRNIYAPTCTSTPKYIPKYSTPSAAGFSAPLDGDEFEMIPVDDSVPDNADFAVRVQGDSMSPYINDGDTVYVKKTSELDVGDVGVFCVDGAMYCKLFFIDESRNLTLVSANSTQQESNVVVSSGSGANVVCYGKVLISRTVPFPDCFLKNLR